METIENSEPGFSVSRIKSIDIIRGLIMVIMAIDHIRVYSGIPAGSTDYSIFFTRWITNFCAPGFAFLAGASAFHYGRKIESKGKLSRHLLSRGFLLVVLELTIIRFFWTFNFDYGTFTLAGIIWMLGWCMVLMSAMVYLSPLTIGITGLVIIFLQQLFGLIPGLFPAGFNYYLGYFWEFIYPAHLHRFQGITILYVIVPWIGVMMAGYASGEIFILPAEKRDKVFRYIGLSAIAVFLLVSIVVALTQRDNDLPFIQQILAQKKYPASQLFLMMTLGPLLFLVPFAERAGGRASKIFETFGKVPFFYYICHILLIHLAALITDFLREGVVFPDWYRTAPFVELEPPHRWSLPVLYLNFICVVFLLYWMCKWYSHYKITNPGKSWLRYL